MPVQDSALRKRTGTSTQARWRGRAEQIHRLAGSVVLGGAALLAVAWPDTGSAIAPWSGAALLVGGALLGVPHGSSDFVVAHRVLKPTLGGRWLPVFLGGYLTIVALVASCWFLAPLASLLVFVGLSCLHFGHGDLNRDERRRGLALATKATTPLLPVLLLHPGGVAPLIALLGGVGETAVVATLDAVRWPLALPWAIAVSCFVIPRVVSPKHGTDGAREKNDALEVCAIALAAVALPPLLAFALYFCLVHAPRHMIGIADDHQPSDVRRASLLVAAIVVPSALICLVVLACTWDGIVGSLGTTDVLAWSIRMIAALTVPHMALEALAGRRCTHLGNGSPHAFGQSHTET